MGVDLLIIGNHNVKCENAVDIIDYLTDSSGNSILKSYAEAIRQNYEDTDLPKLEKDYCLVPCHGKKYIDITDQFAKEGFISFHGLSDCGIEQMDVSPELLHLYPGFRWGYFNSYPEIYSVIHKYLVMFLSKIGCDEIIYMPDSIDIAEFLLGTTNSTSHSFTIKKIVGTPATNALYKNIIYDKHHSFEDIKAQLHQCLGTPATTWNELVLYDNFQYLIERIP